jgi:hypothetical protein
MTLLQYTREILHVLKAKDGTEGTDWEYRIKRKKQLTLIPLPDMYSKEDWDELRYLNRVTTLRIHDALLPTTCQGKPFIILSQSFKTRIS